MFKYKQSYSKKSKTSLLAVQGQTMQHTVTILC